MTTPRITTMVIAAAGRGTRMRELAEKQPKHLTMVYGKPFLHYVLRLARTAGFLRIIVVIGYRADQMRQFLHAEDPSITICVQPDIVGDKLGTAAVLEAATPLLSNESFLFYYGDMLVEASLLEQLATQINTTCMAVQKHQDPRAFGLVTKNAQHHLQRIVEKSSSKSPGLINMGAYAFHSTVFPILAALPQSPRSEYEITDALMMLARTEPVVVTPYSGEWCTLGKPEDIPDVENFISHHHNIYG